MIKTGNPPHRPALYTEWDAPPRTPELLAHHLLSPGTSRFADAAPRRPCHCAQALLPLFPSYSRFLIAPSLLRLQKTAIGQDWRMDSHHTPFQVMADGQPACK